MNYYQAIDLGGTYIKYALVDENGTIIEHDRIPSPGKKEDIDTFFSLMDQIIKPHLDQIQGIGLSCPGIIDSEKGVVEVIGQFPYLQNQNVIELFEARYNLPTSIENDAKCAALAEVWKGNLQDVKDGAVFIIGTAIGGGLVFDKQLRRGKHFFAGEYSGMCMDFNHPEDEDSYIGALGVKCLSNLVYQKTGKEGLDGQAIFRLIEEGNKEAKEALQDYCDLLALALFNLNLLLDLDCILLGGGISQNPRFIQAVKEAIERLKEVHPDIKQGVNLPLPKIDVCRYHNESNLIGAIYHLLSLKQFSE